MFTSSYFAKASKSKLVFMEGGGREAFGPVSGEKGPKH